MLPVEIVGWLLKQAVRESDIPWVLVASGDPKLKLATAMLCRLLTNVNVVAGCTHVMDAPGVMGQLAEAAANDVIPMAKTLDVLVPIPWGR